MTRWEYKKGLHDLGNGIYAYLQPDGSWGWSNAGLVVDGKESILIDTLTDLQLTREMLDAMATSTRSAGAIDKLIITHANPDHFNGNQLVQGAEIIASKACAEEIIKMPRQTILELAKNSPAREELGAFVERCFGQFHLEGITIIPPTRIFEKRLEIMVGNKEVHLIEFGPCHTKGDIIVHVPEDKTVFAGDLLFIGGTPIMWVGPVTKWLRACDMMIDMDAEVFVPGHGPITDKEGVKAVRGYLEFIHGEAKRRYDAGMSADEAVADISLGKYSLLNESERIVVNVYTLYKEFGGDKSPADILDLFWKMAKFAQKEKGS